MSDSADHPTLRRLGLATGEARAWALYDWANSSFATTIMAAFLPIYYAEVAAHDLPHTVATAYWGYTTAIALATIAVLSPVLGAMADYMAARKRFLAFFMGFGVTFTALLAVVGEGDWLLASALFIVANIGFAGANVFYESLLPSVARQEDLDRTSTAGYALGYVGGGILLAVNAAWFLFPHRFGFSNGGQAVRASFVSVALWWALFAVPLFRVVREPVPQLMRHERSDLNPAVIGFRRVVGTVRELRRYPDLFVFLLAFLIYNDGVGTIVKMAAIYGKEVGIGDGAMIGALIVVQFVGVPFTLAFGQLATRMSAKTALFLCLAVYSAISVGGFFMSESWHFWVLALTLATVQGGIQGLSRSLYASMIPRGRSTEFFGFYSVSSKFAGIAGPLAFAAVGQSMGSSRWGILSLLLFFGAGAVLLTRVDVSAGQRRAREAEGLMRSSVAA